ncbi:MAG: FapA family protein [Clostridium sp.]|uniref:FapA family protein n=1 Tax=Clostridium sp. TaxID=1506 RepID=UPI00306E26A7
MEENISPGTAKVVNGKIIITSDINNSEEPWIIKDKSIGLWVDGKEVAERAKVNSQSSIEVIFEESNSERLLNINISEDKMIGTISIQYSPKVTYELEDTEEKNSIVLKAKVKEEKFPPRFKEDEILRELKAKGIIYGIDIKALRSTLQMSEVVDLVVARGREPINPVDDILDIYFECGSRSFESDEYGNVNFKSIGNISSVKENQILAKRTVGKDGTVGINLFSQTVSPPKRIVKDMMVKTGCKFSDKDTVVATIEGRPQVKGCIFQVNNLHNVIGDVDISTGDINFIGDVVVGGDIKEGMKVKAGNSMVVNGNAVRCEIWSQGNLNIKGSAISSNIKVISEVSELGDYVKSLSEVSESFKKIYSGVLAIKNNEGLKISVSDGQIIKIVIESKFKDFNMKIKKLLTIMGQVNDENNKVFKILRIKYVTRNYILISKAEELQVISKLIDEKISSINDMTDIKSNATIGYIQDCNIKCSGSLIVEGKGIYKSYIHAEDSVCFTGDGQSELRGGKVDAINEIRAKTVGSSSGVSTELSVGKTGHIYCDIAHINTKFIVGEAMTILDEGCKNVHVYINKERNLVVDKFKI